MLQRKRTIVLLTALLVLKLGICFAEQNRPILPIPNPPELPPLKVKVGQELFNATLFSKNNTISCNSCHNLNRAGTDNLPKYIGQNRKPGLLNTPTVLNASLNFRQFWDGRAKTIADVVDDHLKDPTVFANNWESVVQGVKENSTLSASFKNAYSEKISPESIKDALTLYLGTLLTPQSPFDRYLKGDKSALSNDALKGYELFKSYGCITCHQGRGVGGNLYQKFGIYKDYFANGKNISKADLGLYNITGKEEDKYVFKVPSLRNVAITGPYLHDGSAATLDEAITIMGIYQVGQSIPTYDIPFIVKFLESLTGRLPENEKK